MLESALAKIPRIIWQTHRFEHDDIPMYISACTESWERLNPDFKYNYVSERETYRQVAAIENGRFNDIFTYKYMSKVTRADIWRLLILKEFGGVYIDCDMVCVKPILDFMNLRKEFAIDTVDVQFMNFSEQASEYFERPRLTFGAMNGIIASAPKGKIIEACCDALEALCTSAIKNKQIIGSDITGPPMLTNCLNYLLNKDNNLSNIMQYESHSLFNGSVVDLNGAFMWNDRINKLTFNSIGNMLDKFLDANDPSALPSGGDIPADSEHESNLYKGFEQVGVKFTKQRSHYS